jgi:uncharacterized protein (DUF1697 family)
MASANPERELTMTGYAALLRGVNVGGRKMVAMSDLRSFAVQLHLGDPRTLLQSGNLVFRSDIRSRAELERLLESEASARLCLETSIMVRSASELQAVIGHNPFPSEAKRDPGHLVVMFLKKAPDAGAVTALQAAITGRETVRAWGTHAYLVYPDGAGRSRLTTALIERTLGTRATGRNWNTVLKLAALSLP